MTSRDKDPVLILGGASDIGLAIARRFARAGHPVELAARDAGRLETERADIALRHDVAVTTAAFDVLDTAAMADFVDGRDPRPGVVVCVVGTMGDHEESLVSPEAAARVMRTNFEGPALILGLFADRMASAGGGTIVGISSVAGDRGRASNYVYGAAKAGLTAFLSGLRNRFARDGDIHVVTVKPGFVATRMTEGMDLPKRLTAAPDEVGESVYRAVQRKRDVVYVRPVWRAIMGIIRALPERVFKKTQL